MGTAMIRRTCLGCLRPVPPIDGGRPTLRCDDCREAHRKLYNREYQRDRRRYEPDLTTAEIEAMLAAGDAERRRTRTRLT